MSKLLAFRRENELTQKEIAKKIGISESYYGMIENEQRNPSYNFIKKFVIAFPECNIVEIFLSNNST